MAARVHIEPCDYSVHLSSDGDVVDLSVAAQGPNGRLRSTAEAPQAQVNVEPGEANAFAERLLQDVIHVDICSAQAPTKRADFARKEE
eukprot:8004673-Pyramimonas_sp.AAC.1